MINKSDLQIYLEQGQAYKKILEKANSHGKHTAKIREIERRLKKAAQDLKKI